MKIGFIGLGIMGKPMAKNLVKAGYDVVVADKFAPKNVEEVVAAGAKAAASNMEVGAQADVLITMVPNSPHVKEALFGEDGAAKTLKKTCRKATVGKGLAVRGSDAKDSRELVTDWARCSVAWHE